MRCTCNVIFETRIPAIDCSEHGVNRPAPASDVAQPEEEGDVVCYKVWVEVERCIYNYETGDERGHMDMALDLLSGAHIAEFMSVDASPESEDLARERVRAFGEEVQAHGLELAPTYEYQHRVAQLAAPRKDGD